MNRNTALRRMSMEKLGKEYYDFDFLEEKNIYKYLCRRHMKKNSIKKMDNNLKFETYEQWKRYIFNKYKDYQNEKLIEFSYFINQKIRDVKPRREFWNIIITIIVTLNVEKILEDISNISGTSILEKIGGVIALIVIIMVVVWFIIWITGRIFDEADEENLYRDYKEVIDEMIEKNYKK